MRAARALRLCWLAVALLSLAGLGLATYLAVVYLAGGGPACGPSGACARVTTSQYAVFLGVPVAVMGAAMYSALLLGSLAVLALGHPPRLLRRSLFLLSAGGVGFSAYLTGMAVFVLHEVCPYCLASAVLITSILAVIVGATFLEKRAAPAA